MRSALKMLTSLPDTSMASAGVIITETDAEMSQAPRRYAGTTPSTAIPVTLEASP